MFIFCSAESNEMIGVIEDSEEVQAHAPPPSLVPRLHAILCHHLKHVNPLVPENKTDDFKTGIKTV